MSDHGHGHSAPKSAPAKSSSGGGLVINATPLAMGIVGGVGILVTSIIRSIFR